MAQINKETLQTLGIGFNPMTTDDLFEREQEIEKRWLEAFREQELNLRNRFESQEPDRVKSARIGQAVVAVFNSRFPISTVGSEEEEITTTMVKYISMGIDFEVILKAIKDNPMLMSEWERFMVSLRMAQED